MKLIFLHFLLFAAPIICFSQKPIKDTVIERNDLIALKGTLTQEFASLKTDVDQQQGLIDSLRTKLATDSVTLAKIKATDPEGQKTYIKNNEKKLQHFRVQIDQLSKKLNTEKDQLQQASDLMKDLDEQIRKLRTRAG
jgi:chromosome segregation ATPase